jgi:hypothetical protein
LAVSVSTVKNTSKFLYYNFPDYYTNARHATDDENITIKETVLGRWTYRVYGIKETAARGELHQSLSVSQNGFLKFFSAANLDASTRIDPMKMTVAENAIKPLKLPCRRTRRAPPIGEPVRSLKAVNDVFKRK